PSAYVSTLSLHAVFRSRHFRHHAEGVPHARFVPCPAGDDLMLGEPSAGQPLKGMALKAGAIEDNTKGAAAGGVTLAQMGGKDLRSEEHTSELQSRENLV